MAIRYVDGTNGDDSWNGLAPVWNGTSGPKRTLNGAEDSPVQAGDTVYVRPGVYREMLTCDVSGTSGNPITYIGDYKGEIWGEKGVVRITGSNDDKTITRNHCVSASWINYRTFRGFVADAVYGFALVQNNPVGWVIEDIYGDVLGELIRYEGDTQLNNTIRRCFVITPIINGRQGIYLRGINGTQNRNLLVENCIVIGGSQGIVCERLGGVLIRNNLVIGAGQAGITSGYAVGANQIVCNNNVIMYCYYGIYAAQLGDLIEDYNNIWGCNTARVNVSTGSNSVSYPPLFDARWFFRMLDSGNLVTPFDLGQWSQLINLAGTNPPTYDMRGTGQIGTAREIGPLEYDPNLLTEGGGGPVRILPLGGTVG